MDCGEGRAAEDDPEHKAQIREQGLLRKAAELEAEAAHLALQAAEVHRDRSVMVRSSAALEARQVEVDRHAEGQAREIDALQDSWREIAFEKARIVKKRKAADDKLADEARQLAMREEDLRIAAQRTAEIQRQLEFRMAAVAAREEEGDRRERALKLAAEDERRRRAEIDLLSEQVKAEDVLLRDDARRAQDLAERLRRQVSELASREAALEHTTRAAQEAEVARQTAYRGREQDLYDVETGLQVREQHLIAGERDVARVSASLGCEVETAIAERKKLTRERETVAASQAALAIREASVAREHQLVSEREERYDAVVNALVSGVRDIVEDRIKTAADIAARPDLAYAANLLRAIGSAIYKRVGQATAELAQRGLALAAMQQKAEAANLEAETRVAAAKEAEMRYRAATKDFQPELKRLRRIRDWAKVVVQNIDHPSLRHLAPQIATAVRGLATELQTRTEQDLGREP